MLGKVLDFIGGGFADSVGKVIDDQTLSKEEKLQAIVALNQSEMESKQKIITSEMAQGDAYTKRARPTVVYFGLVAIGLNHIVLPWAERLAIYFTEKSLELPAIALPEEFWWAWTGVCSAWVIGRSVEKRGVRNSLTKIING